MLCSEDSYEFFNQDISTKTIGAADSPTGIEYTAWDVALVEKMTRMFYEATNFNNGGAIIKFTPNSSGEVDSYQIIDGGSGYTTAHSIIIGPPTNNNGTGTQATATLIVKAVNGVEGVITGVNITNQDQNIYEQLHPPFLLQNL